jgi:hypothetical protein
MLTIMTILAVWLVVAVLAGLVIGMSFRRLGRGDRHDHDLRATASGPSMFPRDPAERR